MADDVQRAALELRKLTVGYGRQALLSQLQLRLAKGQILALLGPNGGGKSTLLKSIAGLLAPLAGQALAAETLLSGAGPATIARHLALVLTGRPADPEVTVGDLVASGRAPYTGRLGLLRPEDRQLVRQALQRVNALDLYERPLQTLSDGQCQRALLARAIAQDTPLIVLDEPTSFLDLRYKIALVKLLRELAGEGKSILLALHEIPLAAELADLLLLVGEDGQWLLGEPAEVLQRQQISELFGLAAEDIPRAARWGLLPAQMEQRKALRRGFSSGTCVTGALLAALSCRAGQPLRQVTLTLGDGQRYTLPVESSRLLSDGAEALLRKDAGDDPDITDQALFGMRLRWRAAEPDESVREKKAAAAGAAAQPAENTKMTDKAASVLRASDSAEAADAELKPAGGWTLRLAGQDCRICLWGGAGIGQVGSPGLKVPVGDAAINPGPRAQIAQLLQGDGFSLLEEVWPRRAGSNTVDSTQVLDLIAFVPEGERLAAKTFNPRLGIRGGLSILGTTGIIEPMSEERWKDSIAEELHVCLARSPGGIALVFGQQGEKALRREAAEDTPPVCEISNFVGFALHEAYQRGCRRLILCGALGKMVKVAAGIFLTHSHTADARAEAMFSYAALCGLRQERYGEFFAATTTEAQLAILREEKLLDTVLARILRQIEEHVHKEISKDLELAILLTDMQGEKIASSPAGTAFRDFCRRIQAETAGERPGRKV